MGQLGCHELRLANTWFSKELANKDPSRWPGYPLLAACAQYMITT